jgi:hypothetical protein
MLPIEYISLRPNKRGLKVDIELITFGEPRRLLGLHQRPNEIQIYQFPQGYPTKDYHDSRHQSGAEHETLMGCGEYYPIRRGDLGTPKPFPFTLKIRKAQKPPIATILGIEQLDLSQVSWLREMFIKPQDLFASSNPAKSRANQQFRVDLNQFSHQFLSFRIWLVEPDNTAALVTQLKHLQGHPEGYRVGSPFAQPVTNVVVHRVEVYTSFRPWLAIALLVGS